MSEFHIAQNLPVLAGAALILWFLSCVWTIVYNVYFHPLKNFPGPFWARATPIPQAIARLAGRQHTWTRELHEQYGPVVRVFPNSLTYDNPEAWKDIFGHKINGRGDLPKDQEVEIPLIGGKDSIILMNDADHSRARRLVAHALSDKALREQQPILNSYVHKFVAKLRDIAEKGDSADMTRWYNFTTFDIIADLSFGEPLGMLDQNEWTPWIYAMNQSIPIGAKMAVFTKLFPPIGWVLKRIIPSSVFEPIRTHIAYSKQQVDKRMARETERPDFWKYIMRNQGKENGTLNMAESHAMGMTLMIAGSETTATLLSGLTNLLLNHPDKHNKLTAEVRGAFKSVDEIDIDSLMSLPYLWACLREGLRLYPPAPIGQVRVVPAGGRQVCGEFVAEGTLVTVPHYAASRSSRNFHRPDEFIPERWLTENQTSGPFANDNRNVVQPFIFGPRNCVGKNLAYHEMRLIMANVLWNFDLELCEESKDWANHPVHGLPVKPALMVKPKVVVREKA